MDDGQTDEDLARLKSLAAFQKVVLGIAMRWKFLFLIVFCLVAAVSAAYLYMRGSQSVRRYQAKTSLLFTPKKTDRVEAMSEKQLIIVLERGSLKRRIADKVEMSPIERTCLAADVKIEQGRRQGNLFKLTAYSKTYAGAVAKANAYADILIDEYVAYRSKDLDSWRQTLETRRKGLLEKIADIEAEEAAIKARTGALSPSEALIALNTLVSDQRRNASALGVDAANEEIKKRKLAAGVGKDGAAIMANAQQIRRRIAAIDTIDEELTQLRQKYTDINPRVVGKVDERKERVEELHAFLKSKGVEGIDIEQLDQIEKAAEEFAECVTRLEAIAEKRLALEKEIKDNEKRAVELATSVMEYERVVAKREDLAASVHELDDQLGGISYAIGSLHNDLRQIERTKGSSDSGSFGSRRAIIAIGGALAVSGGMLFVIVVLELVIGKVRDGREVAAYDDINFLGSLPKPEAMPDEEEREIMGVVALKMLLACKDAKTMLVCKLPGADPHPAFIGTVDFTATLSGMSCFALYIVTQEDFTPPEGAEMMLGIMRSGQKGWFAAANRFALAPTEVELLKADLASLCEEFDNVFIRIESEAHMGGTFFDQLLDLCGGTLLLTGDGKTPRRALSYARHRLRASGKPVAAIATGARAGRVRAEMEVMS